MPYPLPLTRTEAYLAYKAGVIQQSDLKPSLAIPRNGIDAWLAYWTGLTDTYPVKGVGKNIFDDSLAFENGYIATYGNIVASQNSAVNPKYYGVVQNTDYTFSYSVVTDGTMVRNIAFYDNGKNFISRVQNASTETSVTVHAPEGACYMRFNFYNANGITATDFPASYLSNIQLEKGTQASAYEEYTGEPLILQEEEAYIAYLCGVINEYPEKCLRRVGAYLRYLISARWGRPDHPLNREELYLSLLKTQVIPSGDPSSDIVIDGTAKAAFVDVKMYGDTFQQTYTGKNMLPEWGYHDVTGIKSWWEKGELHIQGKATGTWPSISKLPENLTEEIPSGTQLTVSITKALPSGTRLWFREYNKGQPDNTYHNHAISDGGTSITFTTADIMDRFGCVLGTSTGAEIDTAIGIQMETGASKTSYEPFVGLEASPNPEYPQSVQTVTGEQTVTVVGKNLVGSTEQSYTSQGVTTTMNPDGTITCKGTCAQPYFGITRQIAGGGIAEATPCNIPAGTYVASLTKATNQFGVTVRLYYSTGAADYVQTVVTKGSTSSATVTLERPAIMFYVWGSSTTVGQQIDETIGVQFESGSTATSFAPYSKHTYEINLGKNLFDKDNMNLRKAYIYQNTFVIKNTFADRSFIIPCEPNTAYTVSRAVKTGTFRVAYSNLSLSQIPAETSSEQTIGCYGTVADASADSLTIVTGPQAKTIFVHYGTTSGDGQELLDKSLATMQVETGYEKTDYAAYFKPIELCKLGNYQDYIYKDGDDWKVHKATNDVTLTGAEYWQYENVGTSATFFQLQNSRWDEAFGANTHPIGEGAGVVQPTAAFACDGLKSIDASDANMKINQGCGKKGIWFRIALLNTWDVSTAEQLQTWLSTHNMKLKYALATATDTIITNANLIAQLEALVAGGAENGTTYIKVNATDPNLPGLLVVEAPKYE